MPVADPFCYVPRERVTPLAHLGHLMSTCGIMVRVQHAPGQSMARFVSSPGFNPAKQIFMVRAPNIDEPVRFWSSNARAFDVSCVFRPLFDYMSAIVPGGVFFIGEINVFGMNSVI